MSTVLGTEVGVGPLPVTGAGPFSMLIGIIGVASVGIGALLARIARRDQSMGTMSAASDADSWSDRPIPAMVMADAIRWLDAQLAGSPAIN